MKFVKKTMDDYKPTTNWGRSLQIVYEEKRYGFI